MMFSLGTTDINLTIRTYGSCLKHTKPIVPLADTVTLSFMIFASVVNP